MSDEIKISKKMLYMFFGLIIASIVGGYLIFGSEITTPGNGDTTFTRTQATVAQPAVTQNAQGLQEVYLKATSAGYDKNEIVVKKGIPVRLHFSAKNAGCGSYMVIYGLKNGLRDVNAISRNGEDYIVDFTPQNEGTYEYNCGMRMFRGGRFVVVA